MRFLEKFFYANLILLGLVWLRVGLEKLFSGNFIQNLPNTLEKFASKNPYPLYKDFLDNIAIPNFVIFGNLTLYGEILTGLGLMTLPLFYIFKNDQQKIFRILLIGALIGGLLMNATYWLSSAWMSSSNDNLNLLMFGLESISLIYLIRSKEGEK